MDAEPSVARLVSEDLALALDLPEDWELDLDKAKDQLVAVGSGIPQCVGDLCPSITVQRLPFEGTGPEFVRLASESLDEMPGKYEEFELRWSDEASGGRALRCYSFRLQAVDQVVVQLQGLVEADNAAAVFVVNCSAPESTFGSLEPLFRRAVASLESLGPDYVAPRGRANGSGGG